MVFALSVGTQHVNAKMKLSFKKAIKCKELKFLGRDVFRFSQKHSAMVSAMIYEVDHVRVFQAVSDRHQSLKI